jgi:putative ABC transport system substrate-binding protein
MKRREFITLFGGAAAAWPIAASAQQPARPAVGFVHVAAAATHAAFVNAFRQGLRETGFVEGQNVTVEYRWAEGQYDRLPALVSDLVRSRMAVIVAGGSSAPALAAKAATTTIPIVFITGDDPVKNGLVASLNRPAGNVTGIAFFNSILAAKRLDLLHELLPTATNIAYLHNPDNPEAESEANELQDAARSLGLALRVLRAGSEWEIDTAFASLSETHAAALVMAADPFLGSRRPQIIALAQRLALPMIGTSSDYVAAGALMSYGTSIIDAHRQGGIYAGSILKGARPAELPVMQPTKFELAINLKTAKVLGLEVPPTLLAIADQVIE